MEKTKYIKSTIIIGIIAATIFAIVNLSLLFYYNSLGSGSEYDKFEEYFINSVCINIFLFLGIFFVLMIGTYIYNFINNKNMTKKVVEKEAIEKKA